MLVLVARSGQITCVDRLIGSKRTAVLVGGEAGDFFFSISCGGKNHRANVHG